MNDSAPQSQLPARFRVISFDGGPSTLVMLHVLKKLVNGGYHDLLDRVDMFVGTSNGAFASMYLAYALEFENKSSMQAIDDCIEFEKEILEVLRPNGRGLARLASGLLSMNDGEALKKVLIRHFGETRLNDLKKRKLAVVTFDASNWRTISLRSFSNKRNPTLADAALAGSALLAFLPSARVSSINEQGEGEERLMLDGAFGSNSTSLVALTNALKYLGLQVSREAPYGVLACQEPIRLLSLGCLDSRKTAGHIVQTIFSMQWPPSLTRKKEQNYEYGLLWYLAAGVQCLRALVQSSAYDSRYYTMQILGPTRFYRVQPKLDIKTFMWALIWGGPSQVEREAQAAAEKELIENEDLFYWLENHWAPEPSKGETVVAA